MSTRRTARVASVIREAVSTAILQELRDPRIRNVTVLGVEVSTDLRYAKIAISVMGSDEEASLTLHGLNSARGYLQAKVAGRVKTRYTPELRFEIDRGIQKSFEAAQILEQVLPKSVEQGPSDPESNDQDEPNSIDETVVENGASTTNDNV
ncbi:MAG: 30S ribosome-binding factor RbfA [Planctomycetaceae bacterium]|jgi:ribosome-binding factor A